MKLTEREKIKAMPSLKKGDGYHWVAARNKWKVSCHIDGHLWYGGLYEKEEEAMEQVKLARSGHADLCLRGFENPVSKLNEKLVLSIREEHEEKKRKIQAIKDESSVPAMAKRYGVHPATIRAVLSRKTWTHI